VAVYPLLPDKAAMFSRPRFVLKQGTVAVRDGQVVAELGGRTLCVAPEGYRELPGDLAETFAGCYTVKLANYMVEDEYLRRPEVVPCG
jgi:formylmethanofuran dehydrogenase subunit A